MTPDAVLRLETLIDDPALGNADHPYHLGTGDYNGEGRAPWTTNNGGTGSDCWGAVAYAHRQRRHRPGYNRGGSVVSWINCDSAIEDAEGPAVAWQLAPRPEPADLLVWPSIIEGGRRLRWGHVAVITGASRLLEWDPSAPAYELLDVIHVHGPNGRRPAAVRDTGAAWRGRERFGGVVRAAWRSRVLRIVPGAQPRAASGDAV